VKYLLAIKNMGTAVKEIKKHCRKSRHKGLFHKVYIGKTRKATKLK